MEEEEEHEECVELVSVEEDFVALSPYGFERRRPENEAEEHGKLAGHVGNSSL